jgi:8-oxo-dGTP diphosphatase
MHLDRKILLVEQKLPEDTDSNWALPGGVVEPGELLLDGLAREIREETGLRLVDPGSLLYVAQIEGGPTSWMAFIFDVRDWTGDLKPDDPDGYILDARFVPVQDAIGRLEALSWRFMREPIVAYLRGESNRGALWCYREREDGELSLIECVPGAKRGGEHPMP